MQVTGRFYGLVKPAEEIDPQKSLDKLQKLLRMYENNVHGKFFGGECCPKTNLILMYCFLLYNIVCLYIS